MVVWGGWQQCHGWTKNNRVVDGAILAFGGPNMCILTGRGIRGSIMLTPASNMPGPNDCIPLNILQPMPVIKEGLQQVGSRAGHRHQNFSLLRAEILGSRGMNSKPKAEPRAGIISWEVCNNPLKITFNQSIGGLRAKSLELRGLGGSRGISGGGGGG